MQWENPEAEDGVWIDSDVVAGEKPAVWLIVPGAMYLCHYGCAIRFFLIVNGPQSGEVWIDRQAEDNGIIPERGEDGSRLSFFRWYEKWLDDGISNLRKAKPE